MNKYMLAKFFCVSYKIQTYKKIILNNYNNKDLKSCVIIKILNFNV